MKKSSKIILLSVICIVLLGCVGYFVYINSTYLSREEVKNIIYNDTKLNSDEITFSEIDLDLDEETKKYDVEFYYNRVEYKYEIDAKSGKIIYSNFNILNTYDNSSMSDNNYISVDEAKIVALEDANLSNDEVVFTDTDFENKNGRVYYEIDFYNNNLEYEYKIDAVNKSILSKNQEPRD